MKKNFFKNCFAILLLFVCASSYAQGNEIDLSETDIKDIQKQAALKVWQFGEYIATIADTRNSRSARIKDCRRTLNLFIEKGEGYWEEGEWKNGVFIEVTSVTRKTNYPKMLKTYLFGLANLNYPRVYIETTNVNMIEVGALRHIAGNKYECTAYFEQAFTATTEDGKYKYGDITRKSVKCYVFVETVEVIKPGDSPLEFTIKLGDVKALETKPLRRK